MYTAKQVVDVDVLSGGRVDFGVGVGWLREEFEAVAMPFDDRGARAREHLEVMKELWTKESGVVQGRVLRPAGVPHVPEAGAAAASADPLRRRDDAALRRVADLGQGWYGFNRTPEEVPDALDEARSPARRTGPARGRDRDQRVPVLQRRSTRDALERYRDLGVDRVIAVLFAFDRDGLLSTATAKQLVEPARSM